MSGRIRLRQDLTIVDLAHRSHEVRIRVKTRSGDVARIRLDFPDERTLSAQLTALRRWMHLGTPLTYVHSGAEGALIDDGAVLSAALGDVDYS